MTITITIICDQCGKEIDRTTGFHLEIVQHGQPIKLNFDCLDCILKYLTEAKKVNDTAKQLAEISAEARGDKK